ncbi:MAG: ApaG domain-containing protein [Tannerella sp.]|jgi:hypothetical protein|nr:ApaG domain-containing protein [Tannerella sp.]
MIHKKLILVLPFVLTCISLHSQVYIKSEYFGVSKFRDTDNNKTGGKGDLKTIQGGFQIPVSVKMNELNQPTAWAIGVLGSYGALNNSGLSYNDCLDELLNVQLAVTHTRPINEKWFFIAMLGGGVYTDMSAFSGKNFLGQGGVLFIRKINKNLDAGGGIAINNILGYPMAFFSLYLDWHKNGKFDFNISMTNQFELSAGMKLNELWKLRLVGELSGMSAIVDKDGQSQIFVHNWGVVGIQPVLSPGKSFLISMTAGVSVMRDAYYQKRTLKAFFADTDTYPHFGASPYVSIGIGYGF